MASYMRLCLQDAHIFVRAVDCALSGAELADRYSSVVFILELANKQNKQQTILVQAMSVCQSVCFSIRAPIKYVGGNIKAFRSQTPRISRQSLFRMVRFFRGFDSKYTSLSMLFEESSVQFESEDHRTLDRRVFRCSRIIEARSNGSATRSADVYPMNFENRESDDCNLVTTRVRDFIRHYVPDRNEVIGIDFVDNGPVVLNIARLTAGDLSDEPTRREILLRMKIPALSSIEQSQSLNPPDATPKSRVNTIPDLSSKAVEVPVKLTMTCFQNCLKFASPSHGSASQSFNNNGNDDEAKNDAQSDVEYANTEHHVVLKKHPEFPLCIESAYSASMPLTPTLDGVSANVESVGGRRDPRRMMGTRLRMFIAPIIPVEGIEASSQSEKCSAPNPKRQKCE